MNRILVAILLFVSVSVAGQDTLPRFTVTTRGNEKVIISWTNTYPVVNQISIQRSSDSSKNFRTILTVPDPSVLQNGFVDTHAPTPFMFYRLFIVLENGNYVFSKSQRAFWDTTGAVRNLPPAPSLTGENNNRRVVIADNMPLKEAEKLKEKLKEVIKKDEPKITPTTTPAPPPAVKQPELKIPEPEKFFVVKRRDSILMQVPEKSFKKFRDSLVYKTKDTMAFKNLDTIVIRPFVPKEIYRPSRYVFTDKDGNVVISIPEAKQKHFAVKFFEDDQSLLFNIKQVKETMLVIDKVNFLHAGWFRFELYEDDKLKETHKFLIPKDF